MIVVIRMLKNNVTGIAVKKKLKINGAAHIIASVLGGFLLAQSTIGGISSPLIVSLVGSLSLVSGFCAAIGALFAYFVCGTIGTSAVEIGAVVIVMIVKVIICDIVGSEIKTAGKTILSGAAEFFSGLIFSFLTVMSGGGIFVLICRSVLCGAAAYFLTMTFHAARSEKHLVVKGTYGGSLGMVFLFLTASLCSVTSDIFCLGRAAAVLVILIAAKKWKHSGGAVCGIIALCGITLYSPDIGRASMMLPMAGLAAGLFACFGAFAEVFFFVAANAVGMVLIGVSPETARISIDVIAGCAAFILIPESVVTSVLGCDGLSAVTKNVMDQVSSRLSFAADSVGEIRRDVQKISSALSRKNKNNDMSVKTCDRVCRTCKNNLECWEKNFDRTFDGFEKIKTAVKENMRISIQEFPAELEYCINKPVLAKSFADIYKEQIFDEKAEEKLSGMRSILDEQFISMAELLEDTAEQIKFEDAVDERLSEEVKTFISDFGGRIVRGNVYRDRMGILRIEAFYSGEVSLDETELAEELSDITGVKILNPQLTAANGVYRLTAIEAPHFDAEYDVMQRSSNSEYSGDTYDVFEDGKGNKYFIIADGMGSGRLAAVDSKMSVSFFKRLICSGASLETAVRIINSSVRVKSHDESFSTLDILKTNLYSGESEFVKLGAAPSFIRTEGRVLFLEEKTFPVGIMNDIKVSRNNFSLKNGDFVLMMSDGVENDMYPKIKCKLSVKNDINLSMFFDEISDYVARKEINEHTDDITLMAIKVTKRIETSRKKLAEKLLK